MAAKICPTLILLVLMAGFAAAISQQVVSDSSTNYLEYREYLPSAELEMAQAADMPTEARWIWKSSEDVSSGPVTFIKDFQLPECANNLVAVLKVASTVPYKAALNDRNNYFLGTGKATGAFDVSAYLQAHGMNTVYITAVPQEGIQGAVVYSLDIEYEACHDQSENGITGFAIRRDGHKPLFISFFSELYLKFLSLFGIKAE